MPFGPFAGKIQPQSLREVVLVKSWSGWKHVGPHAWPIYDPLYPSNKPEV